MTLKQRKTLYTAIAPVATLVLDYLSTTPETVITAKGVICAVIAGLATYFLHGFASVKQPKTPKK